MACNVARSRPLSRPLHRGCRRRVEEAERRPRQWTSLASSCEVGQGSDSGGGKGASICCQELQSVTSLLSAVLEGRTGMINNEGRAPLTGERRCFGRHWGLVDIDAGVVTHLAHVESTSNTPTCLCKQLHQNSLSSPARPEQTKTPLMFLTN